MPVMTFEKIPPPARRTPAAAAPKKLRSVINQIIDRFADRRTKRSLRRQRDTSRRDETAD